MRKHYADAFEAWDRCAAANIDRRREYSKARDLQAKRLHSNMGTCVAHAGGEPAGPPQKTDPTPSQQSRLRKALPRRSQVQNHDVRSFATGGRAECCRCFGNWSTPPPVFDP
ncbi:hypothetical protein ABIF64_000085 [Bradyrhizobium japonicum]|uniref:Uncharacterized protein n=1 Tax=Bradyrhizobium japonicum TaxID=375 RepID=A0ABV2RLQ7_BRAJP|nr:hypothetical protein [Bradyrhizobium japonicum]MCP1794034.1 hypothetical protein [Bradyrhizobium japonicum]MCP1806468.1 hypothetical protein [Bradyrhizobium japonicum]MCP1815395.1 hypothetical protein [Bradyrhizobium japonicum]MCP1873088.1 hypothetical protein [Bradyrhizobium japonicum]